MSDHPCDVCGERAVHHCGGETPAYYCDEHMPGWEQLGHDLEAAIIIAFNDGTTAVLPSLGEILADQEASLAFAKALGLLDDDEDDE